MGIRTAASLFVRGSPSPYIIDTPARREDDRLAVFPPHRHPCLAPRTYEPLPLRLTAG